MGMAAGDSSQASHLRGRFIDGRMDASPPQYDRRKSLQRVHRQAANQLLPHAMRYYLETAYALWVAAHLVQLSGRDVLVNLLLCLFDLDLPLLILGGEGHMVPGVVLDTLQADALGRVDHKDLVQQIHALAGQLHTHSSQGEYQWNISEADSNQSGGSWPETFRCKAQASSLRCTRPCHAMLLHVRRVMQHMKEGIHAYQTFLQLQARCKAAQPPVKSQTC